MKKDLSEIIKKYIYFHLSHRNDIVIKVDQNGKRYDVKIFINLKPTDGIYARINKGIDRHDVMNGLKGYLNLDWDNCMISYELVEPLNVDYSII